MLKQNWPIAEKKYSGTEALERFPTISYSSLLKQTAAEAYKTSEVTRPKRLSCHAVS